MAAPGEDVPRYAYPLAVAVGLCGLPFVYALIDFLARNLLRDDLWGLVDEGYGGLTWPALMFAVSHAALGAGLGLVWPEKTWRWGVWLCVLPTCAASLLSANVWYFLLWEAATLLPACAGAYAAGRLHLKFAEVEEPG